MNRVRLFLGNVVADEYSKKVAPKEKKHPKPKQQAKKTDPTWRECLQHRQQVDKPLKAQQRAEYEEAVRRDQQVARRKFFFPEKIMSRASAEVEATEKAAVQEACGAIGHVAPNDIDLPLPADHKGKMVEAWCKHGSWGMCVKCHSMCPRKLEPRDLHAVRKATVTANECTACRNGEYVPQPKDVPEPLRNLKPRVLEALRPLEMDTGVVERVPNGYRVHNAMAAFAWKPQHVVDQVNGLTKRGDRRAARAALDFLLHSDVSAYKHFFDEHEKFLDKREEKHPGSPAPLQNIESEGLECSLWPHLYWNRNLCETVGRASHENRKGQRPAQRRVEETDSEETEETIADEGVGTEEDGFVGEEAFEDDGADQEEPNIVAAEHGHIKRGFIRKVLSPVIGYGSDYDLLHFVFDLSMWTTIGTKKNLAARTGVALRHMLKSSPWTPQYWRVRHQAVLDMQRQCGNASLFRTRAPYERSFPYHEWIMHEQATLGRPRQHLAGAETLHMAHVLLQLDKGYICGDKSNSSRASRNWAGHVLGPEDETSKASTVVAHVTRLEFQDGKSKLATQRYHGRGTVHSHSLDFLENPEAIGLEKKLQATIPCKETEPFLHGLIMDSQQDYKDSMLPVREEPSAWDKDTGAVALQHKDAHVRAYLRPTMEITKCHEDVQQGGGSDSRNGAVLHYVATYDMKFSSSMDADWLNGEGSAYSAALGVLRRVRMLEPEMWLTLAQERFPQADLSGTMLDIMAPNFDNMENKPKFVEIYEQSEWRREDMTLLEFLRKSNDKGDVIHYVQEKHKQRVMEEVQTLTGGLD